MESPIIKQILAKRGIKTKQELDEFLNPTWEKFFHDPNKLKDLGKAVKRVKEAVKKKEKIAIYGDFDGDGIPGSAMIYLTLSDMKAESPLVHVAKLHEIDSKFVEYIAEKGYKVLIAVDLGTNSFKAFETAERLGVDLIIIDHHNIHKVNPDCFAYINPKQEGDEYPWPHLCGGALALKFVSALEPKIFKKNKDYFLALTAISIVHDNIPLMDENRMLVSHGIKAIMNMKDDYDLVQAMRILDVNGSLANRGHESIFSSFEYLINIFDSQLSCDLLITNNHSYTLIKSLTDASIRFEKHLNESLRKIKKQPHFYKDLLFEVSDDVPFLVVGAISSRAYNIFRTTTFVIRKGDEFSRGSARSSSHLNLLDLLEYCSDLLDAWGGHTQAVGFRFKTNKVEELRQRILKYIDLKFPKGKVPEDKIEIDAVVGVGDLNEELYKKITQLSPFGPQNPVPMFSLKSIKLYINGLELVLSEDGGAMIKGLLEQRFNDLNLELHYDLTGHLVFKNNVLHFKIDEIKPTQND